MNGDFIVFRHVWKRFEGVPALQDVSFEIGHGELLGLVGQNGAGKSTLMNILGGVIEPDEGEMLLDGKPYQPASPVDAARAGIAFIHQELNLFPFLSIADNLFIEGFPVGRTGLIRRKEMRARTAKLLAAVGLERDPDTPVERLTPGERQLVEIARAIGSNARVIIFDEPTTSLTARETERLFGLIEKLKNDGHTILYISHSLGDVLRLSDRIVVLRDGAVVGGGLRNGLTVDDMIGLMVGRAIEQLYPTRSCRPQDDCALAVLGVTQPGIAENVSFALRRSEVLGIFGLMGSGRSELARIIFGLEPFEKGKILIGGKEQQVHSPRERIRQGMGFVTEDRRQEGLMAESCVADNAALVALPSFGSRMLKRIDRKRLVGTVEELSRALHLKCSSLDRQPVRYLSGGNQQKVVIGKWLLSRPKVLILDEPTRGIDVEARHEVYQLVDQLAAQGTAVLLISSEVEELMGVCDRILVMHTGEITGSFKREEFDQERILSAAFQEG